MLEVAILARIPLVHAGVASGLGIIVALVLSRLGPVPLMACTSLLLAVGIVSGDRVLGSSAPRPRVALDAIVGAMTAMTFLPPNATVVAAAFLLFRLFDLLRPFGISELSSLPGGAGLLLPAFAAGVLANIVVELVVVLPDLAA